MILLKRVTEYWDFLLIQRRMCWSLISIPSHKLLGPGGIGLACSGTLDMKRLIKLAPPRYWLVQGTVPAAIPAGRNNLSR